jgi:hypothetical protein
MNPATPYDPALAKQAVTLSRDVYSQRALLQSAYPTATLIEAGCDRCMVVMIDSLIWVAFMGTHDLASLISDFDVKREPLVLPSSIAVYQEVHSGFAKGLKGMFREVLAAIHARANGQTRLVVTGHSRGGSQALIFAARFVALPELHEPPILAALPIAPARPGNADFRDWYNRRLGDVTWCFQHGADIVPWEPPWIFGNRGVGHLVWFPDVAPIALPNGILDPRQPIVDPQLWELAAACACLTWRGWVSRPPQIEQLANHHIDTYFRLLT